MASSCMAQAHDHLERLSHLAEICARYEALDDGAGYLVAGRKLIDEARGFAKLLKEMELSFVNHEKNR